MVIDGNEVYTITYRRVSAKYDITFSNHIFRHQLVSYQVSIAAFPRKTDGAQTVFRLCHGNRFI
ncbi:hypothetical protein TFUB4_01296 [Tannerella forsythia]|uniref:Uncharacterized protein n=1 Tax=Tannerella forsythia TaxID=28112 RepID=A0A1D3UKB9_TANFO|nr:hypothetical protein TFUB4_01296 [Tannerella forsythia]SCQ21394.1 hypothetical protein TFUB20_01351 [Tannerella forsythia]